MTPKVFLREDREFAKERLTHSGSHDLTLAYQSENVNY